MTGRRMRIGTAVSAALLAVLALAALPAVSMAKSGGVNREADRFAELKFPGTHGYKIEVLVGEIGGSPTSNAVITARKGIYTSNYIVNKASFDADGGIKVHVPGAGSIDLSFVPGRTQTLPLEKGCKGTPSTIQHGTFRGKIALTGRQGFTAAHRASAPGKISSDFKQTCKAVGARQARTSAAEEFSETLLIVDGAKSKNRVVSFLANRPETNGKPANPNFTANAGIVHTSYSFFSEVVVAGKQAAFAVPDLKSLSEATVAPPAPFTGSATFELVSKKASSWTGDLAVDLPGIGKVALTGKGFLSDVCRDEHCTETSPSK
jgi:hypothetical protein